LGHEKDWGEMPAQWYYRKEFLSLAGQSWGKDERGQFIGSQKREGGTGNLRNFSRCGDFTWERRNGRHITKTGPI